MQRSVTKCVIQKKPNNTIVIIPNSSFGSKDNSLNINKEQENSVFLVVSVSRSRREVFDLPKEEFFLKWYGINF